MLPFEDPISKSLELLLVTPILVLNLLLYVKTVRTEKIKRDPWRWLVANTALSMVIYHFFSLPYVSAGKEIPLIRSVARVGWCMKIIGGILIITERFHALRLGKEREGGFEKKAAIILIVFFWLFSIVAMAMGIVFQYGNYGWFAMQTVILLWATLTTLVVFIGTLVLRGRKTTNEYIKNAVVRPALELSCMGFLCLGVPFLVQLTLVIIGAYYGHFALRLAWILSNAYDIAFPIVWIASWSRNREITLNCSGGEDESQTLLNNIEE